jgi:hypothetical protein
MSFYSDASLVMIPSGYKTSKVYSAVPTDGSGDLVFSRSNATATRVGPDGLIEKVRTNLALYSEDLTNAVYTKTNATITANSEIAPDGTLTADTITATSALGLTQGVVTITSGLVYTMSGWLKRKTGTGLINLRGVSNTNTPITITNDWVRYSVSLTAADTTGRYGVRLDVSGDEVYAWGFQLEVGDVMTDYIPTTTAAVSVGPVANTPRIDYLGGGCGKLLLEPQRTNLITFSESFDNAGWVKTNTTITANTTISPDGYTNADTILANGASGLHAVQTNAVSYTSGTAASFSIFAKKGTNDFMQLAAPAAVGGMFANFDLNTGVVGTLGTTSGTNPTSSITDYGNGWYRCVINFTPNATSASVSNVAIVSSASAVRVQSNSLATSIILWGCQIETSAAYATSYIPTLGAAVTRGADACSKTGISSLIGQTEGTLFVEIDLKNFDASADQIVMQLFQNSNNRIGLAMYRDGTVNRLQLFQLFSGSVQVNINTLASSGIVKMAGAYKQNDYVLYINGQQIGVDTSASVPTTSDFQLGAGASGVAPLGNGIKQALLFKTRLSNADLAALTA